MDVVAKRYLIGACVHAAILLLLASVNRLLRVLVIAYHPSFVLLGLSQLFFTLTCVAGAALFFVACIWKLLKKSSKPSLLFLAGALVQILAFVIAQGFLNPIAE